MIKKLRIKFVCMIMPIVTVLLLVIFGMVMYSTSQNMELQSISMMRQIAEGPFQSGMPGEAPDGVRLPFFTVNVDSDGEVISTGGGYFDLSDREYLQEIVNTAVNSEEEIGVLKEYNLRFYKSRSPMFQSIVFADTATEQSTMRTLLFTCILIGIGAIMVFFVISVLLSRWAVRPVEKAWQQQKQFVADASHELKTPLTIIMANAELIQNSDDITEKQSGYSKNILTTSYQMRTLVESLLKLARIDEGSLKAQLVPIDFSRFVEDSTLSFQLLYEEQNMLLRCNVAQGVKIKGIEANLYQLMDVLLDNALKYSLPQSAVDVVLNTHGRYCKLSVASRGEPMSNEELKNIFKRFYRADKARTMNGSYGLGLSIAEEIVTAHKGKIWAESKNGYNVFHILFPIA